MNKRFEEYLPSCLDDHCIDHPSTGNQTIELILVDNPERFAPRVIDGHRITVFCYSCEDFDSLENIAVKWLPEQEEENMRAPFIFVGTKSDLKDRENPKHPSLDDALRVAKRVKAIGVVETSSKVYGQSGGKKGGISNIFRAIIRFVLDPGNGNPAPICVII